ncbi:MAG: transposase [candidate division WOR-3 bacterium]|nr:transposase [candidate division WOR-3 bacterium]
MALTMHEKKIITKEIAKRYNRAKKKQKSLILDELVALTDYNRCYASLVLRNWHRKLKIYQNGKTIILTPTNQHKQKRNKPRIYDDKVLAALKQVWLICDCICGKRLAPYLSEIVPILIQHKELIIDPITKQKLLRISAATIDRLLKKDKARYRLKGKTRTKPGTLLLNQIPIRTFADWNSKKPGFMEIDLVGHDGGNGRGEYLQTLDMTDVYSSWTETQAVKNKAQIWVFEALTDIRNRLPFPLLGIDSDNGSEFINDQLLRYCQKEKISFTRSRPYRKNDNCFVEQKNYSIVRRAVGYHRYQTERELRLLNELYRSLRLYTNYFQPVMKLIEKKRIGSKVLKRYDKPKTPYQRLLEAVGLSEANKQRLRDEYAQLNPVVLKRNIEEVKRRLWNQTQKNTRLEFNNNFVYKINEATDVNFV